MKGALSRLDAYLQKPIEDSDEWEHSENCSEKEVATDMCGCAHCPDDDCGIYALCKGCRQADLAGV